MKCNISSVGGCIKTRSINCRLAHPDRECFVAVQPSVRRNAVEFCKDQGSLSMHLHLLHLLLTLFLQMVIGAKLSSMERKPSLPDATLTMMDL